MRVTEISYSRKVNLGNYESEDYSISGVVLETENVLEQFQVLKDFVKASAFGPRVEEKKQDINIEVNVEAKAELKEEEAKPVEKEKRKRGPNKVKEEVVKEEPSIIKYNRSDVKHKVQFIAIIESRLPSWKATHASQVKDISIEMEGKPFFQGGILLDSFKNEVVEMMGKVCGISI